MPKGGSGGVAKVGSDTLKQASKLLLDLHFSYLPILAGSHPLPVAAALQLAAAT